MIKGAAVLVLAEAIEGGYGGFRLERLTGLKGEVVVKGEGHDGDCNGDVV